MEGTKRPVPLGGMVDGIITPPGKADRIENLEYDPEGFWRVTPGTMPVTSLAAGSGSIISCHWFNPRPGQRWLVYERATAASVSVIEYVDFRTLAGVAIRTQRRVASADHGTLFLEHARWLYMFGASNAPQRWNGQWLSPVGFTMPAPQPSASGEDQGYKVILGSGYFDRGLADYATPQFRHRALQRGVGPYPATATVFEFWRYAYAITMINELGQESPLSPLTFASGFNDPAPAIGKKLVRLKIPTLPPSARGVRIYRSRNIYGLTTPEAEVTLYLLEEFPTAAGFDYLDHAEDSELGFEFDPDSVGPIPTGIRAAAFWQGSLWVGGTPDDSTRLRFSSPLFPEQFPPTNYITVGSTQTGAIVAVHPIQRGLAVFKDGGVYIVKGDPVNGYRVETVSEVRGCPAPRAIVATEHGLFFLSQTGPCVLTGTLDDDQPTKLVPLPGIRKVWRQLAGTRLAAAVAVYQPECQEVWFQIPQGGDIHPSLGLVYHLELGEWSLRIGWPIASFVRGLGRTWVGSWDDTAAPGVHLLTHGIATRFGAVNSARYYTGHQVTDDPAPVHTVELLVAALGDGTPLTVSTSVDREAYQNQTSTGKLQRQNRAVPPKWGTDVWGAGGVWGEYEPARLQVGVRMANGRDVAVRVYGTRMRLFGVNLVVGRGLQREPEGRP